MIELKYFPLSTFNSWNDEIVCVKSEKLKVKSESWNSNLKRETVTMLKWYNDEMIECNARMIECMNVWISKISNLQSPILSADKAGLPEDSGWDSA